MGAAIGPEAIIVFGRLPRAGAVKTRLVPHVTAEQASELYEAFLLDLLDGVSELDVVVRLYVPESDVAEFDLPLGDVTVHAQQGAGLGEKMLRAFVDTFAAGFGRVVILGSDHPTLPIEFVDLAFSELAFPMSIVLGPATDGGFYLLGMNDLFPEIFLADSYSHPEVLRMTMDRAASSRGAVVVLPEWYDVDRPDDLVRLCKDLAACPERAHRTREVVANLAAKSARVG